MSSRELREPLGERRAGSLRSGAVENSPCVAGITVPSAYDPMLMTVVAVIHLPKFLVVSTAQPRST